MKLVIDADKCVGCESCLAYCEGLIEMGSDDKAHVVKDSCDGCDCQEIVDVCPEEAISVEE